VKHYARLADLATLVGEPIAVSGWVTVDQSRIERFAQATDDHQWIHVDAARAAAGPFGATIAHGYLTLGLLPHLSAEAYAIDDVRMGVNYGTNRVRFPAPLPAGSRVRAHFRLQSFEPIDGGAQLVIEATVEREGHDKPVCVAELVVRKYAAGGATT